MANSETSSSFTREHDLELACRVLWWSAQFIGYLEIIVTLVWTRLESMASLTLTIVGCAYRLEYWEAPKYHSLLASLLFQEVSSPRELCLPGNSLATYYTYFSYWSHDGYITVQVCHIWDLSWGWGYCWSLVNVRVEIKCGWWYERLGVVKKTGKCVLREAHVVIMRSEPRIM